MARHKKIVFSGRTDPDTGYKECVELAKMNSWELSVNTNIEDADYVFVGGYLAALEAFKLKKIVLAHYDNPVKKDYWLMHPMAKYIGINGQMPNRPSKRAYQWSISQTWEKLAGVYEQLWQK